MATVAISALPAASTVNGSDLFPGVQGGTTKKYTLALAFSIPPPIGSTTPNTGAFTTLSTSGLATLNSVTTATATITASSTTSTSQLSANALTATGSSQSDAFLLAAIFNRFSTTPASTGARLPTTLASRASMLGVEIVVRNNGFNDLSLYPPVGGTINAAPTNNAITVTVGTSVRVTCFSANSLTWYQT